MLARHFADVTAVVVEPGVRTGVPVLMDNPREVGSDRILNALAAATDFGGPAIVVDFGGTATTFDVVSGAGAVRRRRDRPGIELSLAALGRRGAQLREVELVRPRTVIAKNTVEALQSGLVFGVASQVEGIVARMIAELGAAPEDVRVIATGYLADLVLDECRCFTDRAPWLTLRGLELVFARNDLSGIGRRVGRGWAQRLPRGSRRRRRCPRSWCREPSDTSTRPMWPCLVVDTCRCTARTSSR